ncbi:MAG: DUF859 family phage minor structural protein [Firmicutes bacterium]|nr:DUF859 family phage minor structural protein [Bacillota bacterium]
MPSFNGTTGSPSSGLYLIISYEVGGYNVASNTTPVTVSLHIHHGGLQVGAGTDDCEVHVGSQSYKWKGPDIYSSGGTEDLGSHTFTVTHNTDGTWSGEIGASYRLGITYGSAGYVGTISGKQTVDLPTIPRASSIGATDANIESKSTIVVGRKSSSFTHTIQYKFGSISGYIDSGGNAVSSAVKMTDTTILFQLPSSFYAQIPSAKSGVCTLTCRTYSGNTQIGDAQTTTFSATAAESLCAPDVTGSVKDTNDATIALTGNANKLVRFYSTALCTITAEAKKNATLVSKKITGVDVSGNTLTINNVDIDAFTFSATDSRGYSKPVTLKKTLIPYVRLTCNAKGYRPNPTDGSGRVDISGQYYNGNFGAVQNTLSVKYKIGSDGSWLSVTPTISSNTYTAVVDLTGLDYLQSYTIYVSVSDKLGTASRNVEIMKGIPVFDWGQNDFRFNVPITSASKRVSITDDRFNALSYAVCGNVCTIYAYVKSTSGTITISGFPKSDALFAAAPRLSATAPYAPVSGSGWINRSGVFTIYGSVSAGTYISLTYVCKQ